MSIASRIEAIEQHLTDDYSVLTLAGADLTSVNKNILNLKPTWKERLLYFMNNGTQVVWNNWNKVSGTGTILSLNNTEEAPMSLTYKGNTQQTGTPTPDSPQDIHVVSGDNSIEVCGKNLFDENYYNNNSLYQNNVYRYVKTNIKGNRTLYVRAQLKEGKTGISGLYLGLCTKVQPNISGAKLIYFVYNGTVWGGPYDKDFSGDEDLYFTFYPTTVSVSDIFDTYNFIISTTSTTYEPYTGASYPINLPEGMELCKIGTYQDKIDKSTGKNLFDIRNFTLGTSNGITSTIDGDHLVLNGTASGTAYVNFIASNFNGTCTWGIRSDVALGNLQIQRTGAGVVNITPSTTWNKSTLDSTNVTGGWLSIPSGTTLTNCKVYLYVGEGTLSSIEYEPYGTGWYLKKEIGKVVLDGSESWQMSVTSRFYLNIGKLSSSNKGYCDRFDVQDLALTNGITFLPNTANIYIQYNNETSVNAFKTWLGSNNTTVLYVLATPTYETITDTTLLSQLEALKKSYEGQTNISQVNNDLPFELDVTALEEMN